MISRFHDLKGCSNMDATCACGAVSLVLEGEPLAQVYCHCDDCQHAYGAVYVPRAIFPREAVSIRKGDTRSWVNRSRSMVICARCGSHLYGEHESSPLRGVNAALFPAGASHPSAHLHCRFAVAPVADDLPHYADFPSEFGGTGSMVGW